MSLHAAIDALDLFGAVVALLGLVVLLVSARYVWRATAVFRAADVEALDGVEAGALVSVIGTARLSDRDPLAAPFSGIDCVALRYSVAERRLSVPYVFPSDVTVHEATSAAAFEVETPRGVVRVAEPVHTVTLARDVVATVGPDAEPPDRIADFERTASDVPASTVWRSPPPVLAPLFRPLGLGTRRYVEQRAELADDVTVVGRVVKNGLDPLVVSDLPATSTAARMARTALGGLLVGAFSLALGVAALVL